MAVISSVPINGRLFQVEDGEAGTQITQPGTVVTDPGNTVIFAPTPFSYFSPFAAFSFYVVTMNFTKSNMSLSSSSVNVTVQVLPIDLPATLTSPLNASTSAAEGVTVNFTITAHDPHNV